MASVDYDSSMSNMKKSIFFLEWEKILSSLACSISIAFMKYDFYYIILIWPKNHLDIHVKVHGFELKSMVYLIQGLENLVPRYYRIYIIILILWCCCCCLNWHWPRIVVDVIVCVEVGSIVVAAGRVGTVAVIIDAVSVGYSADVAIVNLLLDVGAKSTSAINNSPQYILLSCSSKG